MFGYSQTGSIVGSVVKRVNIDELETLPFIKVKIKGLNKGTVTDSLGKFNIENLQPGSYTLVVSDMNYTHFEKEYKVSEGTENLITIFLTPSSLLIDQVVVSGTRTDKRQTDSPIIVGVIGAKTLENVQACALSEGLKFQPGLRVETDCQTCNYTQLRMNGLAGGYSQILINGRSTFSPLTGMYGLEQIPTNMIDRIEVVRGGGSALFGSSAIGGTVNIITKMPKKNSFQFANNYQNINGGASENIFSGNATVLSKNRKAGMTFFVNNRIRQAYDHNGDNFSELPALKTTSFGTNFMFRPTEDQKLEVSFSSINEYRYGGEMVDGAAYLAQQAEERTHNVLLGNLDYQINFNNNNSSFIAYVAGQLTKRTHYTGVRPGDSMELITFLTNAPYGNSTTLTGQGGFQLNHRIKNFLSGENVLTLGSEVIYDDVWDEISSYNYLIDQTTTNLGVFLQSDWEIVHDLNLLLGARADKHNFLSNMVVNPRVSLMYKLKERTQFRLTWGQGFRAPQAFDTDMHISFAGGGISRIALGDNLIEERSNSISASVNYDRAWEKVVFGYTIEGFYTRLNDAFYLHPLGEDAFGEVFEKRNGDGAIVQGGTIELRAMYKRILELESGFTMQSSLFDSAVEYSDVLPRTRNFLRTPNNYGYATLFITPTKDWNISINYVYTGSMDIVHFAGAPELQVDEYYTSSDFSELSVKTSYDFNLESKDIGIQIFAGVKNLFNAYQNNFDTGKDRDSGFVYGPSLPRTIYTGIKVFSL
jgi:outer membrane receptor for ferrienterochelin and colicins